jgi:large conductance mechanosensitive channel
MSILGIAGKADFSNYFVPLAGDVTATNPADARKQGGALAYGRFISVVINFSSQSRCSWSSRRSTL